MVATKIPIKVQKRSGFDKSHHNALTQKVGTITPILVDELIPNSKVNLRFALAGSLPPLAVDTYMKCYYDVRAFFVPFRLLAGGFESWFSDYEYPVVIGSSTTNLISSSKAFMPVISVDLTTVDTTSIFGSGTLSDYLGYKDASQSISTPDENVVISALPFLAYHKICNDWFRQPNITKEYFARPGTSSSYVYPRFGLAYGAAMCPFASFESLANATATAVGDADDAPFLLADGHSIFRLRQANYDYDYFTNALPSAQLGNPMTVASASSFTIPALRVANSLQQFAELNQLAGSNLVDVVRARYGANLSKGVAQRCIYLGGSRIDFGSKSVDVTADNNANQNPFVSVVGGSAGKAYLQGTDLIVDGFTAEEPGYLFVVGTIIPKVTYGTGVRRYLRHYISAGSITDMANPLLQNVGNQPIYAWELNASLGDSAYSSKVFGYTDRYGEFMTMEDEVHGLMVSGQSLDSFVAQRAFAYSDSVSINSSFLSISIYALDNITAVSSQIGSYGFYGQFAFDYKVSQPLAQYSLPSLQNPAYEHGETVMVHRGGFRF